MQPRFLAVVVNLLSGGKFRAEQDQFFIMQATQRHLFMGGQRMMLRHD